MTVSEYIAHLSNYPQDAHVLTPNDDGLVPCSGFVLHQSPTDPKQSYLIVS